MRNKKTWISLLVAQVLWAGAVQADTGATADQMWRLLEAGAAHVQAVGPEQAYRDFADRSGKWQQGELRLSVLGLDGKVVLDGLGQAKAGPSADALQDSATVLVNQVREWGHGGIEYATSDPMTSKGEYRTLLATRLPRHAGVLVVGATMDGDRVAGYRSNK
jgi:hypothetical protein